MTTRCGFAAIIGAPNAGKSTLINALVGTKIAIVSPKVQTTRMPVRGIAMAGETQIVFVDTPGIFRPRRRLDRAMVSSAWGGAEDADAVLLRMSETIRRMREAQFEIAAAGYCLFFPAQLAAIPSEPSFERYLQTKQEKMGHLVG